MSEAAGFTKWAPDVTTVSKRRVRLHHYRAVARPSWSP